MGIQLSALAELAATGVHHGVHRVLKVTHRCTAATVLAVVRNTKTPTNMANASPQISKTANPITAITKTATTTRAWAPSSFCGEHQTSTGVECLMKAALQNK